MGQVRIDCLNASLKSAFRNLKSAILLCAVLFALCWSAQAQQPKKLPRIGYLSTSDAGADIGRFNGIRRHLRELGYTEGQNIAIEYRTGGAKLDRYQEVVAELVRLKMDINRGGRRDDLCTGREKGDQNHSHCDDGPRW
jgi:hypothetical protein